MLKINGKEYEKDFINKIMFKNIEEDNYIELYFRSNIYKVYSSYGELYINIDENETKIKDIDLSMIYKVYNYKEFENIGKHKECFLEKIEE